MATQLEAQLQALSASRIAAQELKKKPFTRHSILFDFKEAADVSTEDVHALALKGLNELCFIDQRFSRFKNSLFSTESLKVDREQQNREYNVQLDKSITKYLRLLSPHLLISHSHKTLEYLIRRYKVYLYNIDELLLCCLPYHETSLFVRIIQLISLENTKWHFLTAAKKSGAPLPRSVLIQQLIRMPSLIQTICDYTLELTESGAYFQLPFCVAVIIETLNAVKTLDTDLINRFLPFILYSLQPSVSQDLKVGGLMMVCTVADRATLSEKLVSKLLHSSARTLQLRNNALEDISLITMSLMVIAKLCQTQSVDKLPLVVIEVLTNISDLSACLLELSKTFYVETLIWLILKGLIYHSFSREPCQNSLIVLIDTLPLKNQISKVIFEILDLSISSENAQHDNQEARSWVRNVLMKIEKCYPDELDKAVSEFLESQQHIRKTNWDGSSVHKVLQAMLEGTMHIPIEESSTTIYMSLAHPEPKMRAAAVRTLATSGLLGDTSDVKKINLQEALLRRLHDDDLSVVQSVLSVDGIERVIDKDSLLKALYDVLEKCHTLLRNGLKETKGIASVLASSCVDFLDSKFMVQNPDQSKEVAAVLFSFILIFRKTQALNVKALELSSRVPCFIFSNIKNFEVLGSDLARKKLDKTHRTSINSNIIGALSCSLLENPETNLAWLFKHCLKSGRGKKLIFMILIRSFMEVKEDKFWPLLKECLPFIKKEWNNLGNVSLIIESKPSNIGFFNQIDLYEKLECEEDTVLGNLLIALCWSLLKNFPSSLRHNSNDESIRMMSVFEDLFVLFATSSSRSMLKEHINLIVTSKSLPVIPFLSKFYMGEDSIVPASVQAESLSALASLCRALSGSETSEKNGLRSSNLIHWQSALPSLLVPLCSPVSDIRALATECIEVLYDLCPLMETCLKEQDTQETDLYLPLDTFEKFTKCIVQFKKSFDFDGNFLVPFLGSVIGASSVHVAIPDSLLERFDVNSKEAIYLFILRNLLKFPTHAKCTLLSALQEAGHEDTLVTVTKSLLSKLLLRRKHFHLMHDSSQEKLSPCEVQLIAMLLKSYVLYTMTLSSSENPCMDAVEMIFEALEVEHGSSEDDAVTEPCLSVLGSINSRVYNSLPTTTQDRLFHHLIHLYATDIGVLHNAAMDILGQLDVDGLTVVKFLDSLKTQFGISEMPSREHKRRRLERRSLRSKLLHKKTEYVNFFGALLEFLGWKKDLKNRHAVVGPLFRFLQNCIEKESERLEADGLKTQSDKANQSQVDSIQFQQQILLTVLEDIINSASCENIMAITVSIDVNLVVRCLSFAKDTTTRNHAVLLLTAVAKQIPEQVLSYVLDVFSVMGESTIIQDDSHSQHVSEQLISVIAPRWLAMHDDPKKLFKVFLVALPKMSQYRQLSTVKHLLSVLGEEQSLPVFLLLLLEEAVLSPPFKNVKRLKTEDMEINWLIGFAKRLAGIYPSRTWLSSLINVLQWVRVDNSTNHVSHAISENIPSSWILQIKATSLAADYLGTYELSVELECENMQEVFQDKLNSLMEQAVLQLRIIDNKSISKVTSSLRKDAREVAFSLLNNVIILLPPEAFCKGITYLLRHTDINVCLKGLQLLSQNVKDDAIRQPGARRMDNFSGMNWNSLSKENDGSFVEMILEVAKLVKILPIDQNLKTKLAAVSVLKTLAQRYPGRFSSTFEKCLEPVVGNLSINETSFTSECLNCISTLILELGPQALAHLPRIMQFLLEGAKRNFTSESNHEFFISFLCALEAIVQRLGSFLNPYLEEILGILVLDFPFVTDIKSELFSKAAAVRNLISERIPARLLVGPLVRIYERAIEKGETSISIIFDMTTVVASKMNRSSVATYHTKIFDLCLLALDLRRKNLETIENIEKAERSVINALVSLTMKLSETTFRPLFIKALDWAESEVETDASVTGRNIERNISFYNFIDSLAGKLRGVFVPYFQYLIDGCVYHLTSGQDKRTDLKSKQKKRKLTLKAADFGSKQALSESEWHLRTLVVSSLHKCFLYDTMGFLDSSKFQILLHPLVLQLVVNPPKLSSQSEDIPSINQVDDLLVSCLGQMALTAGSDLLWKPLNHEVLMQTRSEKVRARILGLRVVKFLVEHLKEEYLVLLPETIPFLGELLEDSELNVVATAQEILKYLEELSGESLSQYL